MSTTILDPTVVSKLQQFGRRRFRMLVTRGLCAAIVTFLLCIAVVALIDWYWVLTDQARWLLSIAAYLITGGVVWITSLRKLIHAPGREELATHVEDAEPTLRENLLSAVELATDEPSAVSDSPVFRGLLQGKVAVQMARIQVPRLLPLKLLGKWLFAAFAIVVGVAFLMSLPDPRFRTLAARAVMPGANIDRVSRIQVEILQPTPNSVTIAKDETVAIVVSVSGGSVDEVILETFTREGAVQQSMRARTEAEFAANVHVLADSVEYRILAGDAVTKRHTITAKGRPQVVTFQKAYHYPEYSGLNDETVTEDSGDIVVLQGTEAELQLELDQEVSTAELRIDVSRSEEVTIVPLTLNSKGRWSATVPVQDAAIYKVHLVSKETGFENIFSPRYEIRPVADLIPRAGFVDQQETNLLLPPNDILALKGMAEDDLPLVSLEQEISVNGRDWVVVPLQNVVVPSSIAVADAEVGIHDRNQAAHRMTSEWNWDLLGLKLKTGDQITTRLVAVDRKGNRGESVPLRIVVSAPDFDPERHVVMGKKAALYDEFANFSGVAEEHKVAALEIIQRLRSERDLKPEEQRNEELQSLDRSSVLDLSGKLRQAANQLLNDVYEVTRAMPPGADAYDLDLAGQLIARLQQDHCRAPDAIFAAMSHTVDQNRIKQDLDELKRTFERIHDDAKSAAYHYQYLISHNVVAAVAADFDALLKQQKLVAGSPTQNWSRLLRQETVVLNQMQVVERVIHEHHDRLPDHMRNGMTQQIDWLSQRRAQLEQATESEDKLPELQRLVQSLHRELNDRQRIDIMDGGLAERLNQARRDFINRAGTLSEPLWRMADSIQEECRCLAEAAKAEDSTKVAEWTQQARRYSAEVNLKYLPALDQLRSRRSLTQARIDADQQFAADAGLTQRAATAVLHAHRTDDPASYIARDAFREISPAYRILEAGHEMANAEMCLTNLIQLERWGSQELQSRIDHPRQWDVFQKAIEEGVNALRRAGVHQEIIGQFDASRWSPAAQESNRKIAQRRQSRETMIAAGSDLVELREKTRSAYAELKPVMAEARAVIAKYAPTIPEMAEQIATQVRELEQETTELADAVEESHTPTDPDAAKPELSQDDVAQDAPQMAALQDQQERINQQLDDLFEALIEDANSQNLLDEEQRERARDADDSIAMVQQPAQQMNESLQEANDSDAPEQQAKELSKAAEQQEKTAQALDKVAQHFDRLEKGMDVVESRTELREYEREQGIARQMDQQFENIEQLAEMTQRDSQSLLEELEAELERNPAMQKALSEISKNTVQESRNALQDAAQREQEIQRANERSDAEFQQKKKELADNLKELGKEASELASQLVAQANSAASQAKTPEAQQKMAQTQQKLNEAASAANSANEGELQADLAMKLQQAQQALNEATETLQAGKEQLAAGKNEEIHPDEKNRENAKKNLENQRKRFNDQRKKNADATVRRMEDDERVKNAQVQNAEKNLGTMNTQVQQAKNNLNSKPDDAGRQRAVAQAENRQADAQKKVDNAKAEQQKSQREKDEARQERNDLNAVPEPALNDKNPAAQLAESFAEEAMKAAQKLNQKAAELGETFDFGKELTPTKNQLANATNQQQQVKDDVTETSENVARAARHERRLENAAAAKALQQASENVQQVADNEAAKAEGQLDAAAEATPDAEQGQVPTKGNNQPALAANEAVAQSEQAIANQAEALTAVLTPMQAALAGAAEQQAGAAPAPAPADGEAQSGQQPGEAQPADAGSTPVNAEGSPPPPPSAGGAPQPLTPQQLAQGQQLAQVLDELDRQQAQAAVSQQQTPSQQTPSQQLSAAQLQSLAQAAQARQAQMAAARAQAQQQAALSSNPTGTPPEGIPAYEGQTDSFVVLPVDREEDENWGKLREQAAEDLTKGRKESVSEEYRKSVETYFRVLAERARRNK